MKIQTLWNKLCALTPFRRRAYVPFTPGQQADCSICYAITACNEHQQLENLLTFLTDHISAADCIVLQVDQQSVSKEVRMVAEKFQSKLHNFAEWPLNRDFAAAKNHLNSLCNTDYIFQLDADELPADYLFEHLKEILAANPVELLKLPRINTFWGKPNQDENYREGWPDHQGRIYRNVPGRVEWRRPIHERIYGHRSWAYLPDRDDFAIIHRKNYQANQQKWQQYFDK